MIDVKAKLISIIHKHLPGCKIMLFGSRARGTNRDGADYDIAIDAGSKIPWTIVGDIVSDIEDSDIHVNVDVVDIQNVDASFLEEVNRDAIVWT